MLKTSVTILTVVILAFLTGCKTAPEAKKELLSVDFKKDQTLRYKFVSSRDIEMVWGESDSGPQKVEKSKDSVEYVMAYTPIEVDPYGLSTIKATCESIKASQTSRGSSQRNAVEEFAGKSYNFKISPAGKIEDKSELDSLIKEAGKKAFRVSGDKPTGIKEPDMIGDFTATQWFMWDSVSSIENPVKGVSPGQSWKSQLSVPTPWVSRWARDVTYTLAEIRPDSNGIIAVIKSSYSPSQAVPSDWPVPYSGSFQMSGTFGFLVNYKILELTGSGEELYNIDQGRSEGYKQQYDLKTSADLRMPLGVNPVINIKQTLMMERLENQ